ncbi:MAG TPA: glycosyltransferase family 4 protein [Gemmatimonadaceae bacterium]|nr:glycosyltransferase family 4 protein [Gemmatimonadaceae bacterium]
MTFAPDAPRRLTVLELDTERGWRGGERQLLWHAQVLGRLGHRALIAARPNEPLAQRANALGIPVSPVSPAMELDPRAAWALRRVIQREQVDIVHSHTAHGVALGAMACLGTKAKLVITRHSDFRPRANLGTRWKYSRVDALIAISSASRNAMIASGMSPESITIVRGGSDQSNPITPASASTLASLGAIPGSPVVVQVSQLVQHKDPLTFVAAIDAARARVPLLRAILVGDGPLRASVERAVAEQGLGEHLRVAGYRTDADSLLAAADVVTLSSEEDALPSVLFDALFCGKPICATRAGGVPEIIEDKVSGLLSPVADGPALGESIGRVLNNPVLAQTLSAGARARAPEFSIERSVGRTIAVYERVIGAPIVGAIHDN